MASNCNCDHFVIVIGAVSASIHIVHTSTYYVQQIAFTTSHRSTIWHLEYQHNVNGAEPPPGDELISANHFEGDILGVSLYSASSIIEGAAGSPGSPGSPGADLRNAVVNTWAKWPGSGIPYVISGQFGRQERGVIYRAMREFGELSCVAWRPRQPGDEDYVHIVKGEGCHSRVGKTGGAQSLSLGW